MDVVGRARRMDRGGRRGPSQALLCGVTGCDVLLYGWVAALSSALILGYLVPCCYPWWHVLAAGAAALFVAGFAAWIVQCRPSFCSILDYLLLVFATVVATTLAYAAGFSPSSARAAAPR